LFNKNDNCEKKVKHGLCRAIGREGLAQGLYTVTASAKLRARLSTTSQDMHFTNLPPCHIGTEGVLGICCELVLLVQNCAYLFSMGVFRGCFSGFKPQNESVLVIKLNNA